MLLKLGFYDFSFYCEHILVIALMYFFRILVHLCVIYIDDNENHWELCMLKIVEKVHCTVIR